MDISVAILPEAAGKGVGVLLEALASQSVPPAEVFLPADCKAGLPAGLKVLRLEAMSSKPERMLAEFCRRARGEILLVFNAPAAPARGDWLAAIAAEFSEPEIGAVAVPVLLERTGYVDCVTALVEAVARPGQCRASGRPRRLDMLPLNVTALRREVLEKAGLLKEDARRLTAMDISVETKAFGYLMLWQPRLAVKGLGAEEARCAMADLRASARQRGEHSANLMSAYTYDDGLPAVGLSLLAVFLLPVCLVSLPVYILCVAPIFLVGWWLYARFPLVPVEFPLAGVQLAAYVLCLEASRLDPIAGAIPLSAHPAIVRLWLIPVAMALSGGVVLADMTLRLAAAAARQKCRLEQWPTLVALAAAWLVEAGLWFLRRSAHNIAVSTVRALGVSRSGGARAGAS